MAIPHYLLPLRTGFPQSKGMAYSKQAEWSLIGAPRGIPYVQGEGNIFLKYGLFYLQAWHCLIHLIVTELKAWTSITLI